jgi:hypothetical protein
MFLFLNKQAQQKKNKKENKKIEERELKNRIIF